jgi:hypothetical protein
MKTTIRLLATGLLALASAATSRAGEPARTMAALEEKVQPGTQVDVVDRQGRILRGDFVRADDEGVLVTLYGEGRRVPAGDVMSVTRPGDSLKNGALIGAAVGAIGAFGAFIDNGEATGCGRTATACKVGFAALSLGFYTGVGVLVDRAVKGRDVVYRAPADRLSWSVTPHPVPRGAGVRLALSF